MKRLDLVFHEDNSVDRYIDAGIPLDGIFAGMRLI